MGNDETGGAGSREAEEKSDDGQRSRGPAARNTGWWGSSVGGLCSALFFSVPPLCRERLFFWRGVAFSTLRFANIERKVAFFFPPLLSFFRFFHFSASGKPGEGFLGFLGNLLDFFLFSVHLFFNKGSEHERASRPNEAFRPKTIFLRRWLFFFSRKRVYSLLSLSKVTGPPNQTSLSIFTFSAIQDVFVFPLHHEVDILTLAQLDMIGSVYAERQIYTQ